jgi:hypothetical protein
MNISNIRNIKPGNKFYKKVLAVVLSLLVISFSYVLLNNVGKAARDTVDVIRVKLEDGLPAKTMITADMLEKYAIIRKEFNEDMMTYDHLNEVINKYSLYYMRKKAILFKDQITDVKPVNNAWLYALEPSKEVLTLPYDYLKCGGDILKPGDKIRVRITYESNTPTNESDSAFNIAGSDRSSKVKNAAVLFDSIVVKDLLNASGHSIYEVYKEVQKLSEEKRQTAMSSDGFIRNIQPRSLVLEATYEQVQQFAKYKDNDNNLFTITILSRMGNANILDQLPTVEKEVAAWGTAEK